MQKKRYHFQKIDSTNKKAKEFAVAGAPHGTLVTADEQSAGIGRRGRSWSSEQGAGIYMSLVLRPQIKTERVHMITLVAALAVKQAICQLCQQGNQHKPMIKWPNDIVLDKKKVCGILTELTLRETEIDFVIVGIGINVNNQTFPEDIVQTASSLAQQYGRCFDKEVLIVEIWKWFEVYYQRFLQTEDLSLLREFYEESLVNKDEYVKVLDPLGEYTGVAKGITNTGELIVETEKEVCYVSGGEVSVRGIYGYV